MANNGRIILYACKGDCWNHNKNVLIWAKGGNDMNEWKNSDGTVFKPIPMKDHAPFGEHWVEVKRVNGVDEGIGQFENSFKGLYEAEAWIKKNMENPRFL
jgi:hypothetical protein